MKLHVLIILCIFVFGGCTRKFDPLFEKSQKSFSEKRYVDCIDAAHLALAKWRDSDGTENKAKAYQLLGKAYHEIKKIDKASEAYARAVELSENTYDSAYQLGVIYLASNEPQLAAKSFQDALRMINDDPMALVGLGNAYYDLEKYAKARQIYSRVIDTSPGVSQALEYIGLIDQKLASSNKKKK